MREAQVQLVERHRHAAAHTFEAYYMTAASDRMFGAALAWLMFIWMESPINR